MAVIMGKDKKDTIRILKKNNEHVFKVTKEVIYAIPEGYTIQFSKYSDFLKFAKENPKEVFVRHYYILEEIKEVKEI